MSRIASSRRRARRFIVADTPGHEQYTRNMATGRLHRRCWRDPRRCAQGRADPNPSPHAHCRDDGHPARAARGEQDGSRRVRAGCVRRDRAPTTRRSPAAAASTTCRRSRSRRSRATTSSRRARACRGTTGPPSRLSRGAWMWRRRRRVHSGCRCNGQPPGTRLSRGCRAASAAGSVPAGRPRFASLPSGVETRVEAIVTLGGRSRSRRAAATRSR